MAAQETVALFVRVQIPLATPILYAKHKELALSEAKDLEYQLKHKNWL